MPYSVLRYVVLAHLIICAPAWGQLVQTVQISSSPNPVGSGARALGMGGAFIGIADDATAASWNPGGLIQLESPEVSIVGAFNQRREDSTFRTDPETSESQSVSSNDLNYMSAAYPFQMFNRNMIVSLNYQHIYNFDRKLRYSYNYSDLAPPPLLLQYNVKFEQDGALTAISPAFAFELTPTLSFGFTLNFWNTGIGDNGWDSESRYNADGTVDGLPVNVNVRVDEEYEMRGTKIDLLDPFRWHNANFHLGMMWNVTSKLTFGAVLKSPFQGRFKFDNKLAYEINFPTLPPANSSGVFARSENVRIDYPMMFGAGIAYRKSDVFTIDFDIARTKWDDYELHDAQGNKINPVTGKLQSESTLDATTQVRLGAEYLFIRDKYTVPLRAGVFYDPEPSDDSPSDFWGLAMGSGIAYKNIIFDMAYQYRFGRDVKTVTVGDEQAVQDVDQHTVYASVIYHF